MTAGAEVFQCVDANGRVLLTDAGCPPGYNLNLVVGEPRLPEDEMLAYREEAEARAAVLDAERRAAEAEAARLRAELEAERRHGSTEQDRIDALDRKIDALLERPQVYGGPVYGGTAVVPVPALPWCGPGGGRPWVDCRPPRAQPKSRVFRPDPRDSCGTFGCPPGITHAPWDDRGVKRDHATGKREQKGRWDDRSQGWGSRDQPRRW
jgi:hypothetical protein